MNKHAYTEGADMPHASIRQNLFELEISREEDGRYRVIVTVGNEILISDRPSLKEALHNISDQIVGVLSE